MVDSSRSQTSQNVTDLLDNCQFNPDAQLFMALEHIFEPWQLAQCNLMQMPRDAIRSNLCRLRSCLHPSLEGLDALVRHSQMFKNHFSNSLIIVLQVL